MLLSNKVKLSHHRIPVSIETLRLGYEGIVGITSIRNFSPGLLLVVYEGEDDNQ